MSRERLGGMLFLAVGVVALGGCPDPEGNFNDFVKRVPDAAPIVQIDAAPLNMLPDVTGRFLLTFETTQLGGPLDVKFFQVDTLVMNADGTGTLTLDLTPCAHHQSTTTDPLPGYPVGMTFHYANVPVNAAGEYMVDTGSITIDHRANPLVDSDLVGDFKVSGQIRSTDLMCGTVGGKVTMPAPIDPLVATFGAERIGTDTVGAALPPPVVACPSATVDGGVGIVDGGVDAHPVDASTRD